MKVLMLLSMLASAQAFAECPMIVSDIPAEMGLSDARDVEKIRYAVRDQMVKRGYKLIEEKDAAQYPDASTIQYSMKIDRSGESEKMFGSYHVAFNGLGKSFDDNNTVELETGKRVKNFINGQVLEIKLYRGFLNMVKRTPVCQTSN